MAYFPAPVIRRLKSMPGDPLNLTEVHLVCHFGTHVDAPCHFIPGGQAIDAIALDRLTGPGVVVSIDTAPNGPIDLPNLVEADIRPHDIVVLDTGWWQHIHDDTYEHHPSVSMAAANWLAERETKLFGLSTSQRRTSPPSFAAKDSTGPSITPCSKPAC
jgi:kynurenine formamidase